ncbi:MAG: rod shape-determining protein MreC [Phycisphaerae bacterium]
MARKQNRVSNRMLLVWLTLAGGILLLTPQRITSKFQGAFTHTFRFPLKLGRSITLSARMPDSNDYSHYRTVEQYENHIANLAAELEQKNKQIETLAGIRYRHSELSGASLVMADIITANLAGARNELLINRGQEDGLEVNQFVLAENCIIGTVTYVWDRQARISLITDSSSRLAVKINGMEKPVWMFGTGDGQSVIRWAKLESAAGQNVMVQPSPGFLDSPMVAGRVAQAERNEQNALLWDITVTPACDIQMLPSVMVIVNNPAK